MNDGFERISRNLTKNKVNISVTLQNLNRHQQLLHVQIKNLKLIFTKIPDLFEKLFPKDGNNFSGG